MQLVVDTSALVFAVTDPGSAARQLRGGLREDTTHAPHLLDAEMGSALRNLILRREIDVDLATGALSSYAVLIDHRHEHHGWLGALAWTLRDNLTFYDALYVGLAAALDAELFTLDARLAEVPGLPARVRLATD